MIISLNNSIPEEFKRVKKQQCQREAAEQEILQGITAITSPEFAEQAADVLTSKKHSYGFEWYLILLGRLRRLISAGMPSYLALDTVQTWVTGTTEDILSAWKLANAVNEQQ